MMISPVTGATASTVSAEPTATTTRSAAYQTATATSSGFIPPDPQEASREHIRHMLFGTTKAVQTTIRRLHKLGYAEPNDWSRLIATGRPGEVMSILTKRVDVG